MNDQNMMKKVVLLCLFTVFAVGYALSAGNDDVEKKIDQLLSKMTLEEKIGQINQQTGQGYSPEMVQIVKAGGIGSILNEVDPVVVNKLQKEAMKNSRLHIPVDFCTRRDSWIQDNLPYTSWTGGFVESCPHRAGCAHCCRGGFVDRCALDILSDGRHLARCPLGTLRRVGRRGSLSCRKSGRGDGARISDRRPVTAKHYGCLHKALCRLRCGRGWQRL